MQSAFTEGTVPDLGDLLGCNNVGNEHDNAVGYATIDLADLCSTSLPTDPGYFTTEIRFDNVLIGDYQQVHSANNFAQGNPMVHIRAIPEGGEPGEPAIINFDRTFYSRFRPVVFSIAVSRFRRSSPLADRSDTDLRDLLQDLA
jgi:hypothetical protein